MSVPDSSNASVAVVRSDRPPLPLGATTEHYRSDSSSFPWRSVELGFDAGQSRRAVRCVAGLDDSSHGVRSPSAFLPGRSLCRFASPTPSALRVSHSLSGLSPPGPCGSVSRHIRPWGLFTAFRAFPVRSAVTPLDVRCPLAITTGGLSLTGPRLQGVAPTERPFPGERCYALSRADALLTFVPSEVCQFSRWAKALPSCACSAAGALVRRREPARIRGTSGCRPTEPGGHSVDWLQPP